MVHKTTLIASELTKNDCLAIPKAIKQEIIDSFGPDAIIHWSELLGLGRVVIALESESIANEALELLREKHQSIKFHLSESILPRHKSFDAGLEAPSMPQRKLYNEPEPIYSEEVHSPSIERKRTLQFEGLLKLDTNVGDGVRQKTSPKSPSIVLEKFDL